MSVYCVNSGVTYDDWPSLLVAEADQHVGEVVVEQLDFIEVKE